MEPLFDKTYDELREAFVRARFAEPAVFGQADIEEWLEGECTNEVPSNADTDAWRTLLKHDELVDFIHGAVILLLQKYATTLHDLGLPRHEPTGYSDLLPLVERGLYWGKDNRGIYLHPNPVNTQAVYLVRGKAPEDHEHSLTFDCAGRNNLKDIHETVLEIMFAEWWRGDPKRDAARQYLCEAADVAIRREREAAQRDFDEAVAVSADGTQIVKAKWVLVAEGSRPTSGLLFPASAFRKNKIRRGTTIAHPNIERWMLEQISLGRNDLPLDRFLGCILNRRGKFWLGNKVASLVSDTACRDVMRPGETVLFVDKDLCPFPLPDGGREIAV